MFTGHQAGRLAFFNLLSAIRLLLNASRILLAVRFPWNLDVQHEWRENPMAGQSGCCLLGGCPNLRR